MDKFQAIRIIRKHLNGKPLAYQLGFLQGFLAKTMSEKPETVSEFKRQIKQSNNKA